MTRRGCGTCAIDQRRRSSSGSGFGPHGEGYFRLTAFGDREQTREAVGRIVDGRGKLLE